MCYSLSWKRHLGGSHFDSSNLYASSTVFGDFAICLDVARQVQHQRQLIRIRLIFSLNILCIRFHKRLTGSLIIYGVNMDYRFLVVTLIIRLIIFPLTLKQYRSSKRMQDLQPEMKKLKEKYKDDAKKQQEETMKLFQQNGVNPLAGCFPIIVQMPILIALYQAIMRNPEIHEHTFLWLNLGKPDHLYILTVDCRC